MRCFCLRHVFIIFSVCMIATSSYVLFNLLDIDGSDFRQVAPVCGFEAVIPDCGGEVKSPTATAPVPMPEPLRNLFFTSTRYDALASRFTLPSPSSFRIAHTRNATQQEPASSARGNEPEQRLA